MRPSLPRGPRSVRGTVAAVLVAASTDVVLSGSGDALAGRCVADWPAGLLEAAAQAEYEDGGANALLETLFSGIDGHERIPPAEQASIDALWTQDANRCSTSTYGEREVEDVFNHPLFTFGPNSVFVDVGGGVGRAALPAVLLYNATRGVSLEISASRHAKACQAIGRWRAMLPSELDKKRSGDLLPASCGAECRRRLVYGGGKVEAWQASALDARVAGLFSVATHVFIYGTCFPTKLLSDIEPTLLQQLRWRAVLYVTTPFSHQWGRVRAGGRRFRLRRARAHPPGSGSVPLMELVPAEEDL